jgi:hypothetical protein
MAVIVSQTQSILYKRGRVPKSDARPGAADDNFTFSYIFKNPEIRAKLHPSGD